MNERPADKSLLIPGAWHDIDASFIRIYCKVQTSGFTNTKTLDENKFCIMLETCVDKGFEYAEYSVYGSKPLFTNETLVSFFTLPKNRHNNADSFLLKIHQLEEGGYVEIYSGEADRKKLASCLDEKQTTLYSGAPYSLLDLEKQLKGVLYFDHTLFYIQDTKLFREIFRSALRQLATGLCEDSITMEGDLGDGIAGNGCIKALAHALHSGACQDLQSLTLNLKGNRIGPSGSEMMVNAITSGKCPLNLTIEQGGEQIALTLNLALFLQFLDKDQEHKLPIDIIIYIGRLMGIKYLRDNNTVEGIYKKDQIIPVQQIPWVKHQEEILPKISEKVAANLNKPFTFLGKNWRFISEELKTTINQNIQVFLQEILPGLSKTQRQIFLQNKDKLLAELTGEIILKAPFDFTTGLGITTTGITQIYFNCISTKTASIGCSLWDTKNPQPESASYDELKGDPGEIKKQLALCLFNTLLPHASLFQLELLNEESKDKESDGMKILRRERPVGFTLFKNEEPVYKDTSSYDKYCKILTLTLLDKVEDLDKTDEKPGCNLPD